MQLTKSFVLLSKYLSSRRHRPKPCMVLLSIEIRQNPLSNHLIPKTITHTHIQSSGGNNFPLSNLLKTFMNTLKD